MTKAVSSREEFENNLKKAIEKRRDSVGEINKMIGFDLESCDFDNRSAVFSHTTLEGELNFRKTMHGGIICWLADTSMGTLSQAYAQTDNPTLDMDVNFIKPIFEGDKLLIKASINSVGGHIITSECKIFVASGSEEILAATSSGSFFRLDKDYK